MSPVQEDKEMTPTGLPSVQECIAYIEGLGYKRIGKGTGYSRGTYVFRDVTGKRPSHNETMFWNLNEMRHAVKFGC